MDTSFDFVSAELFHLLFFKQKNLIIYPYVDLSHLSPIKSFLAGFNVEVLDATALYNLAEVLEFSAVDEYSQVPTFHLITNISNKELKKIHKIENIHCIINSNEKPASNVILDTNFVVYDKKNQKFPNYKFDDVDLSFENKIIQGAKSLEFLSDEVQSIKNMGNKIFLEINNTGKIEGALSLLENIDIMHRERILEFVENYYKIVIPKYDHRLIEKIPQTTRKRNSVINPTFIKQYNDIQALNTKVLRSFIEALEDYKKRFDDSNLSIDQLYPDKFFYYLREHHWREDIPQKFLSDWYNRFASYENLDEGDYNDFNAALSILGASLSSTLQIGEVASDVKEVKPIKTTLMDRSKEFPESNIIKEIPSINNIDTFREWIVSKLDKIDALLGKD